METSISQKPGRILNVLNFLLLLGLLVVAGNALLTLRSTSQLDVSTFSTNATVTISGSRTEAMKIGIGSAHIRIKPGDYYVSADDSGLKAGKIIHIKPNTKQSVALNPETTPTTTIPTIDTIDYVNFDELLQNGLSLNQVTNLKELFLTYKKNSRQITITTDSVQPGVRDPSSINFNISYSGKIDGVPYKASVIYSGFSNVSLTLINSSGTQIFNGSLPIDGIDGAHS